jgi:hypothetical protein
MMVEVATDFMVFVLWFVVVMSKQVDTGWGGNCEPIRQVSYLAADPTPNGQSTAATGTPAIMSTAENEFPPDCYPYVPSEVGVVAPHLVSRAVIAALVIGRRCMRRMLTSIKILAPPSFGPTIPPTDRLLRRSDDVRVLRRSGLHFFLGGGWGLLRHDHSCVWPRLRRGWSPLYDATRPQLLHRAANRAEGLCCTKACGRCEGVEEEGCESRFAVVNPSTAGRCCSANIRSLSTSLGIIFSLLFALSSGYRDAHGGPN